MGNRINGGQGTDERLFRRPFWVCMSVLPHFLLNSHHSLRSAGKSRLSETLSRDGFFAAWGNDENALGYTPEDPERHKTPGIAVRSETLNGIPITIYDFAGHLEYYLPQELCMTAMKRAVYVLVARMDTELDDRDFGHWFRFLKQLSHVYRPKIFLVGTHRDKLEDGDKKRLPDNTWTCGWGDVSCVCLSVRSSF